MPMPPFFLARPLRWILEPRTGRDPVMEHFLDINEIGWVLISTVEGPSVKDFWTFSSESPQDLFLEGDELPDAAASVFQHPGQMFLTEHALLSGGLQFDEI